MYYYIICYANIHFGPTTVYYPKCIFEGQMKTKYIGIHTYLHFYFVHDDVHNFFFFVKLHTILLNISIIQENV